MTGRLIGLVLAALIGASAGSAAVLTVAPSSEPSPRPGAALKPDEFRIEFVPAPAHRSSRSLLAWSPSPGLPAETERVLERVPGVRHATTVLAGLDWLIRTTTAAGVAVRETPRGLAVPVETAIVDPDEYARFVPPGERDAFLSLEPGDALLATTEAELRGPGEVAALAMTDRRLVVTGVASDVATNGYEIVTTGAVPAPWDRVDRFVLMQLDRNADRRRVERRLRSLLEPGQALRVRAKGEVPYLRYGDAVLPQMLLKQAFGEFAAAPLTDGTLRIDPAWRRSNIRKVEVPTLGAITCHRTLVRQLRAALQQVVREGLAHLVHPRQFGGCYSPRFINRDPEGRLSHHSWGIAVDINAFDNAYGTKPDQDMRLVEIMEEHGFTWGGRWLVPDGMHFEWVRFP